MEEKLDELKRDIDELYLTSVAKVYKEALEEILAQEPGLWKTMQRIAAKALGVEYVEDA